MARRAALLGARAARAACGPAVMPSAARTGAAVAEVRAQAAAVVRDELGERAT